MQNATVIRSFVSDWKKKVYAYNKILNSTLMHLKNFKFQALIEISHDDGKEITPAECCQNPSVFVQF